MELIWQMTTMEEKRKLKNISNKCAIRAIESFRPVTLSSLRSKRVWQNDAKFFLKTNFSDPIT